MRYHLYSVALFFVGALLTLSYAHVGSLKARDDDDDDDDGDNVICPKDTKICSHLRARHRPTLPTFIGLEPAMKLPSDDEFGNDMDIFMHRQTKDPRDAVFDGSVCTAVYSLLEEVPVHWYLVNMCGCTGLVVVSEKAVFFAHYFENLAFCGSPTEPSDFRTEVLEALGNGNEFHPSLNSLAGQFKGQRGLGAFIMTPTKRSKDSKTALYAEKVERLRRKVKSIIGIRPEVVLYNPEHSLGGVLGTNALGTALFQYDPDQRKNDPKKLVKVWIERKNVHTHEWGDAVATSDDPPSPAPPESTPLISPYDPPADPECHPTPPDDVKIKDAHAGIAKWAALRFCDLFANSIGTNLVSIIKDISPPWIDTLSGNDMVDDVYQITLKSIEGCSSEGGFNLNEPLPGRFCKDIVFDAWEKCECNLLFPS